MSYVPIVPHVPHPEPSPRARRLAVELEETIERFEQEQGRLDAQDVRHALGIVERSTTGPAGSGTMAVKAGLVAAAGLGVLVLGLFVTRGGGVLAARTPIAMGAVVGLLAVGAVIAVMASRK